MAFPAEFAPFTAPLKPAVIVSVSSCNDMFTTLEKISTFAGLRADFLKIQAEFQGKYRSVLDFSRPMGFVLLSDGEMFYPLFFLPIQKENENTSHDGVQLLHDRLLRNHLQKFQAEQDDPSGQHGQSGAIADDHASDVSETTVVAEAEVENGATESETGEIGERPLFFFDLSVHVEPGEIVLMPDGEKRMLLDQYLYPWPFGSLWGVQKGDWVYIAVEELLLPSQEKSGQVLWGGLPDDPSILLDRLNEKYLLAGRFDFSGFSRELFNGLLIAYNMLVHAIDPNEVQSEYRDLFRGFGKYCRTLVNEVETFDRGLKFDSDSGNLSLVTSIRVVPDSALSRSIGANRRQQSGFGSFLRDDGSFFLVVSDELTPPQQSIGVAMSRIFRNSFLEQTRQTNPPSPEDGETTHEIETEIEAGQDEEQQDEEQGEYTLSDNPEDFIHFEGCDEMSEYDFMPDRMTIIFGEPFANCYKNMFQFSREWVFEQFGQRTAQPLLDFIESHLRYGTVDVACSRGKDGVFLGALRLNEGGKVESLFEHVDAYFRERKSDGKPAGEMRIRSGEYAGFTLSKLTFSPPPQVQVPLSPQQDASTAETTAQNAFPEKPARVPESLLHELSRKKNGETNAKESSENEKNAAAATENSSPTRSCVYFAVRSDMLCFVAGHEDSALSALQESLDALEKPVSLSKRRVHLTSGELERFLVPNCADEHSAKLLRQMISNQADAALRYEIEFSNNEISKELKIDGAMLGILAWFFLHRESNR